MNASLSRLRSFYGELKTPLLLHAMITREFAGCVGVLITHNEESATLLELISLINPSIPVLMLSNAEAMNTFDLKNVIDVTGAVADSIEDMALLAIITDERREVGKAKIELDAEGVFRIYPFAQSTRQEFSSDWSV